MNFTELTSEMVYRGANNDSPRNGTWINQAYRQIANAFDWPFTVTTATGTTGAGVVTVADFRKAIYVTDISQGVIPGRRLEKITYAELVEDFGIENFALTGTPQFWYWDGVAGAIKTYPLGGTIHARYHKRLDPLTSLDSPVFDEEYHNLIVDRAMVEFLKDAEEQQQATTNMQLFLQSLGQMAQDYQVVSREHSYIQVGEPYDG